MDTVVAIVLLALISSSTAVTLNDGDPDEDPATRRPGDPSEDPDAFISGIDVIVDGEVRWRINESLGYNEFPEVHLGEDRREIITFRCKQTPLALRNANATLSHNPSYRIVTWEVGKKPSLDINNRPAHYRKVLPTDAIPTEFEPGPHTTGGADLVFHVTELNNEDYVRCEISFLHRGGEDRRYMQLKLTYPVAADVRQTNGEGKYYGQKKFTVAASGNPDPGKNYNIYFPGNSHGLSHTRLDVVHEGNTITTKNVTFGWVDEPIRWFIHGSYTSGFFEFGVDRNLTNEIITLKIVRDTPRAWGKVLWLKQVRVAELVYPTDAPNRGSGVGVTHAVIIAVVCFIVILTQLY